MWLCVFKRKQVIGYKTLSFFSLLQALPVFQQFADSFVTGTWFVIVFFSLGLFDS